MLLLLIAFISTPPSSSRETILSAELSLGHYFMSSVDHSTADAMKPSISKGYHLGSVNSSLVNLYLTPPFPPLSPSCVTLSSHLSAGPYPFIKAQLTCIHHTLQCMHFYTPHLNNSFYSFTLKTVCVHVATISVSVFRE